MKKKKGNKEDEPPKKVRLNKNISGLDTRNPYLAMEWLGFFLDEDEGMSLKKTLKDTPWTLTEFYRYAEQDPYFAQMLREAELLEAPKPPPPLPHYIKPKEIGDNMKKNSKQKTEEQSCLVKKRELTPAEKQRIQKMNERCCHQEPADFFKIVEQKDKETTIAPVLKESLSLNDSRDDLKARWMEATGLTDINTGATLLGTMSLALKKSKDQEGDTIDRINYLGRLMREFQPKDAVESSLCSQIVVCQEKGMRLLARAEIQDSSEWARTQYNAALKLLTRAQNALQTLISYRRGGQQKVVVEHVNVESGGQAIVGHVEHTGGG